MITNDFSPPPISPHQLDILRVVTAMAWADGQLEPDEIKLMLEQFAALFAKSEPEARSLIVSLREYLDQNLPLEESLSHLRREGDRKLVLKLCYQVIQASRRTPDEPKINLDEIEAYQRLLTILDLPAEEVAKIEAEAIAEDLSSLVSSLHNSIINQ
jgi:hypothetical protein